MSWGIRRQAEICKSWDLQEGSPRPPIAVGSYTTLVAPGSYRSRPILPHAPEAHRYLNMDDLQEHKKDQL